MSYHVYCITNSATGKQYVGITTKGYKNRFANHIWHARRNSGKCSALHDAIRKYGVACFSVELLQEADSWEKMNQLERDWIARLGTIAPNGYNLTDGGDAGVFAEPTRQMMSERLKGKPISENTRQGVIASWNDPERRAAKIAAIKEAMNRDDVRKATSERQKGVPKTEAHIASLRKAKARAVVCVETGMEFEAITDAVRWLQKNGHDKAVGGKLSMVLGGKRKTAYGYHWNDKTNS